MKQTALARTRKRFERVGVNGFTYEDFYEAARRQRVCAVTHRAGRWQPHHVIEKQEVKRRGGDIWDPRNALRLETPVHERHTNAVERVLLSRLTDANLEYAFELMGRAAYVYLTARYSGYDPRVELRLTTFEYA